MLVHRVNVTDRNTSFGRNGILYLGALREVFVLGSAICLVMVTLWQSKTLMNFPLTTEDQPSQSRLTPVLGLGIDRDQGTILAHIWGGELSEFSLETGAVIQQTGSPEIICTVASERNSIIANLSEWADEGSIHHRVDICRRGEVVVSEEFGFDSQTSATVHLSADAQFAVAMMLDGLAIGWDLSCSPARRNEYNVGIINMESSLSPDGRFLFVSSDQGTPYICDARTGGSKVSLIDLEGFCCCSEWSSDGKRVAIGNQLGEVMLFDARTGKKVWKQQLGFMFARSITVSSEGTYLAAGGFDHTIRIWNFAEPDRSATELTGQLGITRGLVFGPGDKTLVSASSDGTIHEWSLITAQSIRQLR